MMDVFKLFFNYVGIFFVAYLIGYSTFLLLAVLVGSSELYGTRRKRLLKNEIKEDIEVPVSIIVPAYNEEITIGSTLLSLLELEYKTYEIIIVDDGSTDKTADILISNAQMHKTAKPIHKQLRCCSEESVWETFDYKVPVTLVCKKNGGKADALNMGINIARYPYYVCVDADSILQYDSLQEIVRPVLENENVVAVGGAVRPCNGCEIVNGRVKKYKLPRKILPCMQVLEYDRSFLAARLLFDKFNGSLIISGAFGLFKKDVVIAAGGYDSQTMGEDMELVVKLHVYCREHGRKYLIRYACNAICWSQVPESLKDLAGQRRRWHIGLFQSMMQHRRILANPKYGTVGFLSYIYFLIYELFSPYIEVFGVLTIITAFTVDLINVPFMILFFLIYAVYSSVLSLTAFFARVQTTDLTISFTDVLKAIALCFFETTVLRFILAWVRMAALIGYRKKKETWGNIERKKIQIK
ncbi:MAG: glycosyltransferase [Clostridiales bacterium]|nr:glycosyltransferase [Clostridiales bacterium]